MTASSRSLRWPTLVFDLDGTLVDTIGLISTPSQRSTSPSAPAERNSVWTSCATARVPWLLLTAAWTTSMSAIIAPPCAVPGALSRRWVTGIRARA